jgi:hypothetical protein
MAPCGKKVDPMSGMNPAEFANIAKSERDFWWYRGMRAIFFRALEPHLAGRRLHRVAGSGLRHRLLLPFCFKTSAGCP